MNIRVAYDNNEADNSKARVVGLQTDRGLSLVEVTTQLGLAQAKIV